MSISTFGRDVSGNSSSWTELMIECGAVGPASANSRPVSAPGEPVGASTTASAAPPPAEPPKGGAGFRFGQALAEARAACTAAGFDWHETSPSMQCSGTLQTIGVPARTVIYPCSSMICGVDLITTGDAQFDVVAKYDELCGALERKYGVPEKQRAALDPECVADLRACVNRPGPPTGASWKWPDGTTISIRLAPVAGSPVIDLSYAKPASAVLVPAL